MFAAHVVRPVRCRPMRRMVRRWRALTLSAVLLLVLHTTGTVSFGGHAVSARSRSDALAVHASGPSADRLGAESGPRPGSVGERPDGRALGATQDMTRTEVLALERAVGPLAETYPDCPLTVETSGSIFSYRCNAAAGHFFTVAIEAFADEPEARTRFEALRQDHPIGAFHGFVSAAWEVDERPNGMRHRFTYWQAGAWVFGATAFDDTEFNVAADPAEMAERMHEAAQAVGMLAGATPVGGWDVQHLDGFGGSASAVTADGVRVYVGVGQSLEIVDFADPAVPHRLGSRPLDEPARDIVLDDDIAIVAQGESGIESIDVSDPTDPMPRDTVALPARGLALDGDFLVIAGGAGEETGLWVRRLDSLVFGEPSFVHTPGDALAVATAPGHIAFLADGWGGLRIVDIADRRAPAAVGWLPMTALDVAVPESGPYVIVAAGDDGVVVVDAADPAAPGIAAAYVTELGTPVAVAVAGDVAYVSLEGGDIVTLDISTPSSPKLLGTHAGARPIHGCGGSPDPASDLAAHLSITGGRAYAAARENGLRVLDVTTPGAPIEIGSYASIFTCALDVRIAGDRAYVAADRDGLRVLGWGGDRALQELGAVTGITATMLAVGEGTVYAADSRALWIVDVHDPESPAVVGSLEPFGRWILNLTVQDGFAYLATAGTEGSLTIVDVREPSAPRVAGAFVTDRPLWSVALSGPRAFVTDGSALLVIDVTDPASPHRVGRLPLPGMETEIDVAGQYLYVAHAEGMLHVVDIADPTHPRLAGAHRAPRLATLAVSEETAILSGSSETAVLSVARPTDPASRVLFTVASSAMAAGMATDGHVVLFARGSRGVLMQWIGPFSPPNEVEERREFVGQLGGTYEAVLIDGDIAHVGIGPRLVELDVSDPAHPVRLGQSRPFRDVVQDVALRGRFAIVAAGRAGTRVVDVSNRAGPREVGHLSWPEAAREVVVVGHLAFVADAMAGLAIVDVAEPTDPRLVAVIGDGGARSVAVADGHAYVLADTLSEVQVYDIGAPSAPRRVGTEMFLGGGSRLALAGQHLFIAALDSGLIVLDVTDPAAPVRTGWLPCRALDVAVRDDRAYVAGEEWLSVIDVADPSEPRLLGTWRTPGGVATVALDAAGRAVMADPSAGLRIVDASEASAPHEVGAYRESGEAHNVFIEGYAAYVAAREGGLDIVSITYPPQPVQLSHLDVTATDVLVEAGVAYVAGLGTLSLYDVGNPSMPEPLGAVELPGEATDLAVGDGLAFVAVGESGLAVVDVSDADAPRLIGAVDTPGEALALAIDGRFAYVADGPAGLRVVDVSEPSAPTEVGAVADLVGASGVMVQGAYAFVTTQVTDPGVPSICALALDDPAVPRFVGALGLWGAPAGMAASGNTVYVAAGRMGVSAIDATDSADLGEFVRYDVPGLARGVFVQGPYVFVAADRGGLYILERGVPRAEVAATLFLPDVER